MTDSVVTAKNALGKLITDVIIKVDWTDTEYAGFTFAKQTSGGGKKKKVKGGNLVEDVSNLGGLVQDNHSPFSFASSDSLGTLLGTTPSATANIHLHGNPAYNLTGTSDYTFLDRSVHGGKKKTKKTKK